MNKVKLGLMAIFVIGTFQVSSCAGISGADLYKKCSACHGIDGSKAALGKSKHLKGMSFEEVKVSLKEYRAGTKNVTGMGGLMKGQVSSLKDVEISNLAEYISNF